ncbi:MAG: thymidine phosphorylase family protein [Hyphomicrobiaceae bacterium]
MSASDITHAGPIGHDTGPTSPSRLTLRRLGIDTYREHIVYMRADCHVCQSEGFVARSRVRVAANGKSLLATLNVIRTDLLGLEEASLSEAAWSQLGARNRDIIEVTHAEPVASESFVRAKAYGERLDSAAFDAIIGDIARGLYSDLHLAAFVTACAGDRLDLAETTNLTKAMIGVGDRISWPYPIVADKHCVGGLPGNRTTMLVVPIIAALGLPIPKTSSRAITSPAGTADTMETVAPVTLDQVAMRRVVEKEAGCIVWGGAVQLSPADDILIQVERPLDFDSDGQLVASVLSKKAAAGATHIVLDLPVGPTAKVRSREAARRLGDRLVAVGAVLDLNVRIVETDGSQPVGRGIGPALEARDVLMVLQRQADAPVDLRDRALNLAGELIELVGRAEPGGGIRLAAEVLSSGQAWRKFQAICDAQGGMRTPSVAGYRHPVLASAGGRIVTIDNRRIAKAAKLAGAPQAPAAGIDLHVRLTDKVEAGQSLFTVHAQSRGELEYALHYIAQQHGMITIEDV